MKEPLECDQPIKILIIAPALPIVGGQTVQANRLLDKLQAESSVKTAFQPINPIFLKPLQSVRFIRTVVTTLKYVFDLLLKIPRCDVVHIFSASYYSFMLAPTPAVLISKLFGKRAILNYRSGEAEDHLTRWKRTAVPTVRMFDKIVVPSDYLVGVFENHGFDSVPIFNFVDTELFSFRKRDPFRPVFLSNRNFEAHYNVSCILKAFHNIQKEWIGARLIVVGGGPEREYLQATTENLGLRNVEFYGQIEPSRMPEIYGEADIYLNSPNIDNMPSSLLEAFSSGLPVVTTNAGGIPYIVENEKNGLLVEINDHEGMANAAIRLLRDKDLARRVVNSAREEVERYSWENVRKQWLDVYHELANRS